MSKLKEVIYALEDYARQQSGRFWLLDINTSTQAPPKGGLHIVVDFEKGGVQASIFVDIVCKKHRMPNRVSHASGLTEEFRQAVLPNALVLWGPPYSPPQVPVTFDVIRRRYADLVPSDFDFRCEEGWVRIVDRYLEQVKELLPEGVGFEMRSVKQKFGLLEIEWRTPLPLDDAIERKIVAAAALAGMRSCRLCELCGQPGVQRMEVGGRIFTACDPHDLGAESIEDHGNVIYVRGVKFEYDQDADAINEKSPDVDRVNGGNDA